VLAGDLDRALAELDATATKEFPEVNGLLAKQKIDPIVKLTEEDWGKHGDKK